MLNSTAHQIAGILLEDGEIKRVCAGCQKELGIPARPGESHGFCRRHALEYYGEVIPMDEFNKLPDSTFCPDLSKQDSGHEYAAESVEITDSIIDDQGGSMDPKSFISDQADLHLETISAKLEQLGVDPKTIDGVEVYGMIVDDGDEIRTDAGDEHATLWGSSIHTTDESKWIVDYDDYSSPESALEQGRALWSDLTRMLPGQTIHFVDEISN